MSAIRLAPSLAAAPMGHLAQVVADLEAAGADALHFDLEDGQFVPVMTLGTRLIGELRPLTRLPFDVHLMVHTPEAILPEIAALGADSIAFHWEATGYPRRVLRQIRELGKRAGLAFNPATPLPDLTYLLPHLDYVILLTTEPETPDCPYLPPVLEKVRQAAAFARAHRPDLGVCADGGIGEGNIAQAAAAGANWIVCGRAAFAGGAIAGNLARLRAAAGA